MPVRKIRIILTNHCKARAVERYVTTQDISKIISNPVQTIYDEERQNYKSFGKAEKPPYPEQPYLVAIHNKINTSVRVITVMWTDKGGLKIIGFNKI
ncbi:protein of unknown function [Nitrosotalea devaniterrae]|uniref:DUF4258 domain-containing protein n=1 Tax=Nitrosotalea devaniterrae TaxID=1078905 RepID=A0A128A4A5_9ARCH|nr:protein of unknown function [Candidatus Nitrosotalea devanaterra]